jgi:hypothetical protein
LMLAKIALEKPSSLALVAVTKQDIAPGQA